MNIQSINNNNYNTNFKSKIVPTEFLSRTIDYAIENPKTYRNFLDSLIKILNDGKNNIIKFDYSKSWLLQKIKPGAYNIIVNDKKVSSGFFLGSRFI